MGATGYRLALTALVAAALLLAVTGYADRAGTRYADQGFKRALVTFAVARGLNGVISVAQGTEVAVEPAGIGVNFTPGQILDPVNDLVERFSWVMLASTTSLGLQGLLLDVFSARGFTVALALVALALLLTVWVPRLRAPPARRLLARLLGLLIILRFVVPVMAMAGEGAYALFLQTRYESARQGIEQTTERIERLNQQAEPGASKEPPGDTSLLDRARRLYDSAVGAVGMNSLLDRYEAAASDVAEQVVNLIVVFLVQTVVLPLLFLWASLRLLRRALRIGPALHLLD